MHIFRNGPHLIAYAPQPCIFYGFVDMYFIMQSKCQIKKKKMPDNLKTMHFRQCGF